ncbi:MAG TPA: MFS transporter [Candidatus Polarisedimenticolia bacterium]|nr:MFS transporter [Candidatus Polarisedimenticolia bacterium]
MSTEITPDANLSPALPDDAPLLGGLASATTLALTMFVEAVGYGVVAPTLPFLARQAGAGETRIGFLVGLYAAVGLLVSIPFGVLANRHGRRTLILVGLACLAVASLGYVVAVSYPWLLVARCVQGLGASAIWVGSLTVAADLTPSASMGRALSLITGSWSLGFVVGPALGGIGSVRFPFILYAMLSATALVAGLIGLPETGRVGTRTTLAGILRVLRRPAVLASAAATVALSFYYGTVEAFLPLMVSQVGVKRAEIGLLFAVAAMPAVVLPRLSGQIADRIGDVRLIVGGLLFGATLNAVFLLLFGRVPLWGLFFLVGMVEVLVYVPAVALLNRGVSREERIFATGSHSYAFSSGFFLGPLIGGMLIPLGGYPLMFGALSATMLLGIAGVLMPRAQLADDDGKR